MNREEQLKEIADNLKDRELFPESNAVAKETLEGISRNEQLKQAIEEHVAKLLNEGFVYNLYQKVAD